MLETGKRKPFKRKVVSDSLWQQSLGLEVSPYVRQIGAE